MGSLDELIGGQGNGCLAIPLAVKIKCADLLIGSAGGGFDPDEIAGVLGVVLDLDGKGLFRFCSGEAGDGGRCAS